MGGMGSAHSNSHLTSDDATNGARPDFSKKSLILWILAVPFFVNDTWAAVNSLCKKAIPIGFSKNSIKAGCASMLFFLASQYRKVNLGTSAISAKSRWLIV